MSMKFKILNVITVAALFVENANAQVGVTMDNLNQNADQSQGNYDSTNLNYLGGVGSLGMMQSAWKDPMQHMGEGQTRPGYSKYYWTPEVVLPVRVREGMYTLINFPSWEVIENVYVGDGVSFNARIEGPTSLMVYPVSSQFVGVDTNMVVFGRSGNKYVFYVQSETVNTDRITNAIIDIEVVNDKNEGIFSGNANNGRLNANNYSGGPNSEDATFTRSMQKEDWIENIPVDPTKFRFDIEVYVPNPDDIIIAPERVWRDNIFTYIDLGEKALTSVQRPIVTLIVERSETPVGFRAAGPNNRLIIVEAIGDMVLRSGKRMVCLKLRRADSDGLENAVYAKSNEWDIQNQNAHKNGKSEDDEELEDVYGGGNAHNHGEQGLSNTNRGYFNNNSFFQNHGNTQNGNSGNMSYEDMLSGNQNGHNNRNGMYNNNGGAYNGNGFWNGNGANTRNNGVDGANRLNSTADLNGNTNGMNGADSMGKNNDNNGIPNINNIPKVNPMILSDSKSGQNNGTGSNGVNGSADNFANGQSAQNANAQNGENKKLIGQYDIDVNGSEIVNPEYAKDKKNNKTLGNSDNNSSPILINSGTDSAKNKKAFVSAETEALLKEFREGKVFPDSTENNISIELGTDENVNNLEKLWSDISKHYSATIGKYQPFYSVDTAADGQGKELFHLRVGPVKSLDEGDNICSQLGRNGIFCSVVRIQ